MRNLITRVILWFVAVPALIAVIILLPFQNHLVFNAIVIAASALGASELARLFRRHDAGYRASTVVIPLIGGLLPVTQVIILNGLLPQETILHVILAVVAVVLLLQVFRRADEGFQYTLSNSAANITLFLYPGLFLSFVVRLSDFEHATAIILTFLCMVFFNDTVAYLAGMAYRGVRTRLAGRKGRAWEPTVVLPVSPKKTIVGFAGGLITAPVTLILAHAAFPDQVPGSFAGHVLVGLAVGLATIFGDLIESALKRSATSKDSGSLIPGRGGILDSVDSVLYAAPVFYYLFRYLL